MPGLSVKVRRIFAIGAEDLLDLVKNAGKYFENKY